MLKLKNLRFSNIGRFVEEQSIDISGLGNLVQIDGNNLNTKGSSGSGKTTVFNALDYLLGLNDLPTTVLQSRLTKEPITAIGEFDWDGRSLTVTRSKKGLSIEIDGNTIEGSSKLTEEKLDEILGMPRDLFRKILHKRQKEGGFFLDFTPKEMYEFLTDCLNLKSERDKLQKIENKIKDIEINKNTGQTQIMSLQSALSATKESILALGLPPIKDFNQSVIIELKGKYDGSHENFKKVEEKHRIEREEIEKNRPKVISRAFDTSEKERLENRIKERDVRSRELISAERDRQAQIASKIAQHNLEKSKLVYKINDAEIAKKAASEIATQIKKIRDAICPTCEQNWLTENAKTEENKLLLKLAECKEKINLGIISSNRIDELTAILADFEKEAFPKRDPELSVIEKDIQDLNLLIFEEKKKASTHTEQENKANNIILSEFANKQSELRLRHSQELDSSRGQMELDRRALETTAAKLMEYENAKNRYESSLNSMKAKEEEYFVNLGYAVLNFEKTDKEMTKAEELKRIVKSFISCSFDDALETIGDAATQIIRSIPTMSNATIQFEGTKETKDGKVKEEVNAVISVDGEIGIPIKSLSGGERSSVDLAVDLAVIDFVESKSSKGIDVFILDEPFTGLDTVSIEMALEVLKNSSSNKKLIIVDHNPEVKEMVNNRLIVVRDGNISSITTQEATNG